MLHKLLRNFQVSKKTLEGFCTQIFGGALKQPAPFVQNYLLLFWTVKLLSLIKRGVQKITLNPTSLTSLSHENQSLNTTQKHITK